MSISTGATDVVGGYPTAYGGGFGGLGGLGLVGLVGLNSFFGRDGFGRGDFDGRGGLAGTTVLEQNVSNIREEIGALGNEIQNSFAVQTAGQTAQFNQIADLIMSSSKENALLAKDAIIAGMVNTQSIKDQAAANQVINQENFCSVKSLIQSEADQTRALITTNLIDGLRAELAGERRGRDNREVEINIQNTATATQNQLQVQLQQQQQQLATFMNVVGDQLARQTNSVVNLGSMIGSGQSNSANQTKVNS